MAKAQVIEVSALRKRGPGVVVSATKAVFYVLGITQPAAETEKTVAVAFWGLVSALALACLAGTLVVLKSVSALR
ncbi:MAG: hypothetical protein NVS9B15_10800 [Acidobacteriaceae bacterium]